MNETIFLDGVALNQWNNWENKAEVFYGRYGPTRVPSLLKLIRQQKPDIIFINGLYSFYFNILPLLLSVFFYSKPLIVLSARGMLHPGALSQKAFKKKLFLFLIKIFRIHKKVRWHATDEQEAVHIKTVFGNNIQITVAGNFPNLLTMQSSPEKIKNKLVIGTIALISPMKNHIEVLNVLKKINHPIEWHIYGPVKDENYWQAFQQQKKNLPSHIYIIYHGECEPNKIPDALKTFQVFIMPSKSENFGHALLEALSAGKPVITTDTTPFKNLQAQQCGYTVLVNDLENQLKKALQFFTEMDSELFKKYSNNAINFAKQFVDTEQIKIQYRNLFN